MPAIHYDAAREVQLAEMDKQLPPLNEEILGIPDTALRSFERVPEHLKTEFSAWMTHEEKDRLRLTDEISQRFVHPVEINRHMNFIIWFESIHPMGSRNVAALAFNRLFQQEGKPEPKKHKRNA